jgi:hypothetical protein
MLLTAVAFFFVAMPAFLGFLIGAILMAIAAQNLRGLRHVGYQFPFRLFRRESPRDIRDTMIISAIFCLVMALCVSALIYVLSVNINRNDQRNAASNIARISDMNNVDLRRNATEFVNSLTKFSADYNEKSRQIDNDRMSHPWASPITKEETYKLNQLWAQSTYRELALDSQYQKEYEVRFASSVVEYKNTMCERERQYRPCNERDMAYFVIDTGKISISSSGIIINYLNQLIDNLHI